MQTTNLCEVCLNWDGGTFGMGGNPIAIFFEQQRHKVTEEHRDNFNNDVP